MTENSNDKSQKTMKIETAAVHPFQARLPELKDAGMEGVIWGKTGLDLGILGERAKGSPSRCTLFALMKNGWTRLSWPRVDRTLSSSSSSSSSSSPPPQDD